MIKERQKPLLGASGLSRQGRQRRGELLDELARLAGLGPCDRLLEIGCATGKATLPLAQRPTGGPRSPGG